MIKLVVFDLDNTLYDFDKFRREALRGMVQKFCKNEGLSFQKYWKILDETIQKYGLHHGKLFDFYKNELREFWQYDIKNWIDFYHQSNPSELQLFNGFYELILFLKRQQLKTAILTDGNAKTQHHKMTVLNLQDEFDFVLLSAERQTAKPNLQLFREIEYQFQLYPEEIMMVGDHPDKDILGAKRAGWQAVRMVSGEHSKLPDHPEAKPDQKFETLPQLTEWLQQ